MSLTNRVPHPFPWLIIDLWPQIGVSLIDKNQHCKHSESPKSTHQIIICHRVLSTASAEATPVDWNLDSGKRQSEDSAVRFSGLGSYMKCEEIPNLSFLCIYIYVIYVIYHVDTTRINSSMQLHHSQVQTHSGAVPWGVPEKLAERQFFCRCMLHCSPYIPIQRSLIP